MQERGDRAGIGCSEQSSHLKNVIHVAISSYFAVNISSASQTLVFGENPPF